MTTPTPAPQEESSPQTSATETPRTMGFFNRVRREIKIEPKPIHPTEEQEIVIMDEDSGDR